VAEQVLHALAQGRGGGRTARAGALHLEVDDAVAVTAEGDFQSGRPVLAEGTALAEDETEEFYDEADHDTVVTIKDLLETHLRPLVDAVGLGDGDEVVPEIDARDAGHREQGGGERRATKADGVNEWPQVKPAVLGAIMDHFQSGRPVLAEGTALAEDETEEFYDEAISR
jgi:hypothetical protein